MCTPFFENPVSTYVDKAERSKKLKQEGPFCFVSRPFLLCFSVSGLARLARRLRVPANGFSGAPDRASRRRASRRLDCDARERCERTTRESATADARGSCLLWQLLSRLAGRRASLSSYGTWIKPQSRINRATQVPYGFIVRGWYFHINSNHMQPYTSRTNLRRRCSL